MKHFVIAAIVASLAMIWGCEEPTTVSPKRPGASNQVASTHRPEQNQRPQWQELKRPGAPAPAPAPKETYLGVEVAPVPKVLSEYLGLPEGMGLMVTEVAPNSPAAEANLAKHDILARFNDQILVNAEQLVVLVRHAKAGDVVRLAVVRQGKEMPMRAKLGSREVRHMGMPGAPMWPGMHGPWMPPGREGGMRIQVREGKEGQIIMIPEGEEGEEGQEGEGHVIVIPGGREHHEMKPGEKPGQKPGEKPAVKPVPPPHATKPVPPPPTYQTKPVFEFSEEGKMTQGFWDNEYGLMIVTDRNGKKTLTARNLKEDKTIFDGPINTSQERSKVPAPVMRRLERIEKDLKARASKPVAPAKTPAK